MLGTVEGRTFDVPTVREIQQTLLGARAASRSLARIVSFVDARRNEVFRFILGPMLGWDLNCALSLEAWRAKNGPRLRRDLDALARLEALVALGTRAFERPGDAWPEVVEDDETMIFRAEKLGHPLIPAAKVVRNDVVVGGDHAQVLLVTGSNMSGKSTLLRAVGANVVLALAGAPVRAASMRCSPFAVHTSMRVRDSLSEGVSHFFAELQRLKQVVDAADGATRTEGARPVLFLLDEILHGTNSRERHLGARAIVRHLASSKACGAVSTHDLALAALEKEIEGKVTNVHFREQVARDATGKETMTFDYRLLPGVVTSSNALRLMRIVGIDVTIPEEPA
jgi:DNA mismatch repair ATPase MutS